MPLPIGSIIADRYRVERFVDEGGMAQVFEATNLELDERVALKLAHPVYRSTPALVGRFRAEARALARIRSEHVARVFDVIATDDGDPVMVMEFLEGEDLARLIERKALPPQETMVGWMIEVCSGLAVAHANGIVHRDVKPGNLFIATVLGGRRTVKVLDFGISRLALTSTRDTPEAAKIAELKILGTPIYMAPEQILSANASDPRIDVWSIGVVLFELLTGELPFAGATMEDLCAQIIQGRTPDVLARRRDLDPELAAVVERCLQRDVSRRFPSVADVAVALLPFAPAYHVSSVDQTVNVLKAAGLTTVDVPAVISIRPSNRSGSMPDTMVSVPITPTSPPPASSSLPVVAATETPAARPAHVDRSRWLGAVAVAAVIALGASFLFRHPASAPAAVAAPAPVEMRFETDPPGAMIEIDGAGAAMSPATSVLLPGRHLITFTRTGYERLSTMVDVTSQSTGQLARFPLVPRAAAPTTTEGEPTAKPVDDRPTARATRSGRIPAVAAAAAPGPTSPAAPTTRPTVKVIDDSPSTTRVIQ
jgi:serine/threonine-protein kinase